jgi:formylglycine-generating enzyme required for sulfatase activity
MAIALLWSISNIIISSYPVLSSSYLITLLFKRTVLHSIVVAGIISFVWGFSPRFLSPSVCSGFTIFMLLGWGTLFLVYRPVRTYLLQAEGTPSWMLDSEYNSDKKTPYGHVEILDFAKLKRKTPTKLWLGERISIIVPVYRGISEAVKTDIKNSVNRTNHDNDIYLGLFVDDLFEEGQIPLGLYLSESANFQDDIEQWLLHLVKNAETDTEKENIYLFGASIKQLIPDIEEISQHLNLSGILFFPATNTFSPLTGLADNFSFLNQRAHAGHMEPTSVCNVISAIESYDARPPNYVLLKRSLVQFGAVAILTLPLLGYLNTTYIKAFTVSSENVFYNESIQVNWETNAKKVVLQFVSTCNGMTSEPLVLTDKSNISVKIKSPGFIQLTIEHEWWWPFPVNSEEISITVKDPEINNFLSSACQIEQNSNATLTWQQKGTQAVIITDNHDNRIESKNQFVTVKPSKDTLYHLSARSYQCAVYKEYFSVQLKIVPKEYALVTDIDICGKDSGDNSNYAFLAAKYELTNREYNECVNSKECKALAFYYDSQSCIPYVPPGQVEYSINDLIYGQIDPLQVPDNLKKDNFPVICISWEQATQYADWKSKKEDLEPCYFNQPTIPEESSCSGYRLPTLKEWEYMVKGPDLKVNCDNMVINSDHVIPGCGEGHPWKGGSKLTDKLNGIYDVYGNVREWTSSMQRQGFCEDGKNSYMIVGDSWVDGGNIDIRERTRTLCQNQANVMTGVRLVKNIKNLSNGSNK